MKDPIVEEVRKIRSAHQEQFHNDWDEIIKDLKKVEKQSTRPIVSLPPKRSASSKKSAS